MLLLIVAWTIVLPLDLPMVSFSDVAVSLRKVISTEVRRRHGAESLVGGVEDCRLSLLFPFPSPPDRPGSRDEILCWWYCIVTAQISQN